MNNNIKKDDVIYFLKLFNDDIIGLDKVHSIFYILEYMGYIKLGFEEKKYFIYSNTLKNIIDDLNKENNILDITLNNSVYASSFIDKIDKKLHILFLLLKYKI